MKINDHEQPTLPYRSRTYYLLAARFLCLQRRLFDSYIINNCRDSDPGAYYQRLIGLFIGSHIYGQLSACSPTISEQ
jgi:hypothetical protein